MPARPFATLAAAAGVALALVACGGSDDLDARIDDAADRAIELEDAVAELSDALVASTTAVPPPATQPPRSTTLPDPDRPEATTTTEAPELQDINEATAESILELVGEAAWDTSLPIPSDCVSSGSFAPAGELGVNGGTISCSVRAPAFQVEEFLRFALTRAGFAFDPTTGDDSFNIEIGSQATITGVTSGDRTSLNIEQRF